MKRKLISLLIAVLILGGMANAAWKLIYEPLTERIMLDYTIFSGTTASGDILYHDGTNWVVLNIGANGEVLTLAAGLPSWAAAGLPGAHAASHEVGGVDLVDHDQLTNYLAAQHLTLPNMIAAVLTDHNVAAHTNAIGGTGIDSSGWSDYIYVTAGVWAVDPTLGHNANGLNITANADMANIILDGTNLNIKWSDGNFIAMTDEGTDTASIFQVIGKGTGTGQIYAYDTDADTYVGFSWPGGDDAPNLTANADLDILWAANNDVDFFAGALSGETRELTISGHRAGDVLRAFSLAVGSVANDTATITGLSNYTFDTSIDVNKSLATGEIGINFYSITPTFSTIAQSDAEGIANVSDLRIGLDDANPTLIICTRDDIMDDFGLSAATNPSLVIYNAAGSVSSTWAYGSLTVGSDFFFSFRTYTNFSATVDLDAGHMYRFRSNVNIELTDADGEQAHMSLEPRINQGEGGGANYVGFLMNVTETNTDSTGINELMALRVATVDKFTVDNSGYAKAGTLSGALNDDATYATTIPDSWTGIVIVQNTNDTTSGVYHLDGTAIAVINQNAAFTTTQGTDNKINVYVAGNVLTVENTHAAAKTVRVMFIGT